MSLNFSEIFIVFLGRLIFKLYRLLAGILGLNRVQIMIKGVLDDDVALAVRSTPGAPGSSLARHPDQAFGETTHARLEPGAPGWSITGFHLCEASQRWAAILAREASCHPQR
jgi:hypothetical protein